MMRAAEIVYSVVLQYVFTGMEHVYISQCMRIGDVHEAVIDTQVHTCMYQNVCKCLMPTILG